jgi:inner membrane transporter RhtA
LPVLPYALELQALRQMSQTAFGTLMALEPAIGLVIGLIALNQQPSPIQLAGITIVVLAGAVAQQSRHSQRDTDRVPLGLGATGSEAAPAGYGEIS